MLAGHEPASDPAMTACAGEIGRALAARHIRMITGATQEGLMGSAADACLRAGGQVIGVMPDMAAFHGREHPRLTELHLTADLAERKQRMADMADAFLALPGGLGTMNELLEFLTWNKLGLQAKPVVLVNVAGYWDPLIAMLRAGEQAGFMGDTPPRLMIADKPLAAIVAASFD